MSEAKVELKLKKPAAEGKSLREQLSAIKTKIFEGQAPVDPIAKARRLVADNYNDSRNIEKMPMLTPELVDIVSFTGTKANWRATGESSIVHGIRYDVTYNAERAEAYVYVYRKIATVKVENA